MRDDLHKDERIEKGQIHANFIIEILGSPKEHIVKTLKEYVAKIKKDPDLLVLKEDFAEPKPQDKMFICFVEIELWLKDITKVVSFCIDAMPSSVEVIDPQEFRFGAPEFTSFLNDLQAKIHHMDFTLKDANAKVQLLTKNSAGLMKNFIFLSLKEGAKTLDEIGSEMGIQSEQLKPFVDIMIKKNELAKEGNKFTSTVR